MKKIYKLFLILMLFSLANCSDIKKGLGIEKEIPDEFLVKKLNPLKMPPNYDLLPPDEKNKKMISNKNSSNEKIKSIIDSSINKNSKVQKKTDLKVETQDDLENEILKELSK